MALFNKFFFPSTTSTQTAAAKGLRTPIATGTSSATSTASTKVAVNRNTSNNNQSENYLSQFPFDGRQIRILLYRECDGRRLLFDSNALEKVFLKESNGNVTRDKNQSNESKNARHSTHGGGSGGTAFIEVCSEYGYKHNRPTSEDISSIGEMVFGASAMSFRGTAFKLHWLHAPSRILCSQVFLNPVSSSGCASGTSPYSTLSMNSLATPRTSISSEHGSIDGLSMNSFSMPFSVSVARHLSLTSSERSSLLTCPLDMPDYQQQHHQQHQQQHQQLLQSDQMSANSGSDGGRARSDSAQRCSSVYSTVTDSGYSGFSRSQLSSDQWSASYQYSTRSSLGSVMSDQSDRLRKLSVDSAFFPSSATQYEGGMASDGSLQRRICRNLRTSFENENSINDLIGFISDYYPTNSRLNGGSEGGCLGTPNYRRSSYCANETRSNPEIGKKRDANATTKSASSRRAKLGLAVIITLSESFEEEMEIFCSEHIALLESMLSRLRVCTERAYLNYKDFYQIMFNSWQSTQQWFSDIFTAPRVKCPVWLSITTSGSKYSKSVAESFMKELCWLLSLADTKDTNFFISTVLTAILTHHLGWVATVSAFNSSAAISSEASAVAIKQRAKLQQVSQKHPYNALWAQMGDLYGAIGMPPKLTRTIIYGTDKLSVERLLKILTYFIRCSEVRRSAKREDFSKELINSIVVQNKNETVKKSTNYGRSGLKKSAAAGFATDSGSLSCGGLTRTQTCKQSLNTITDDYDDEAASSEESDNSSEPYAIDEAALVRNAKKNEIPNVLAFRDSRFVQQELRIGNYLMDTGIEKSAVMGRQNSNEVNSSSSNSNIIKIKEGRIRLTLTTPDNVELHVAADDSRIISSDGVDVGNTHCDYDDGAVEAIEIEGHEVHIATPVEKCHSQKKRHGSFLWKMVPQTVKDGLSLNSAKDSGNKIIDIGSKEAHEYTNDEYPSLKKRISHLSLSDLITQNSMGKSDRMTWGIEPVKENVSFEEQIHFDFYQKRIEREHGISRANCDEKMEALTTNVPTPGGGRSGNGGSSVGGGSGGVVFVLGDNEPLVNIKKSTEDLTVTAAMPMAAVPHDATTLATTTTASTVLLSDDKSRDACNDFAKHPPKTNAMKLCPLHQRTHGDGSAMHSKKHSGVKFNFEEYPQIVTNYMKSKNLVMSNYDLLMEKCSKLEMTTAMAAAAQEQQTELETKCAINKKNSITTTATSNDSNSITSSTTTTTSSASCIICNGILNSYQTPSNATELEFETDEEHSYSTTTTTTSNTTNNNNNNNSSSSRTLHTVSSATSIDTIKSMPISETLRPINNDSKQCDTSNDYDVKPTLPTTMETTTSDATTATTGSTAVVQRRPTYSGNVKKMPSQRSSISSVAAKCAAVNEAVHFLKFPIPGIKELPQDDDPPDNMKLRAGLIPSLFLNVNDHYVSDAVLQGTKASPKEWEYVLREDLALAAHSASLISLPVENIAIVADMEKWDVRLISSQAQMFPYANGLNAPVGMSQLVSSMLEAVQVMNASGISAYECLSYLESKLQEIYLQSETLAAFLLETDFCSLSAVTAALNLTENDVPLLLSIASIHTPQISKKCGISFR